MKIKLFNREIIAEDCYNNSWTKRRLETNEELENRINEFMADKKVIDIKYQEGTYGTYEDMSTDLSIIVMYEEVQEND